ncbi:MAG: DotA/TraY family protein [Formivibrio sp.]|nr:DotA/TraY family protein [Formivibrio sp.]
MAMSMPFTPSPDDSAVLMLRQIFGPVIDHILGTSLSVPSANSLMLAAAFQYFNSGVLFFGAMILSFVTVFGVANTANDGQALGKKWSTFFTPLRSISASALLIPTAAGLSGIQILVLTVVLWSVGLASGMWSRVVDVVVNNGIVESALINIAQDQSFRNLTIAAVKMKVCGAAVNKSINQTMAGTMTPINLQLIQEYFKKTLPDRTIYTTRFSYKDQNWPSSEKLCGSVNYSTSFPINSSYINPLNPSSNSTGVQQVSQELQVTISNLRYKFISAIFSNGGAVDDFAQRVIKIVEDDNGGNMKASELNTLINSVQSQIQAAMDTEIKKVTDDTGAVTKSLSAGGWIWAGSWHRELSRIKDSIQAATSSTPIYTDSSGNLSDVLSGEMLQAAQLTMDKYNSVVSVLIEKGVDATAIQAQMNQDKPTMPTLRSDFSSADFGNNGNGVKERINTYFNRSVTESAVSGVVTYLGRDGGDPVMQLKDIGDWLIVIGQTLIVVKAALAGVLTGLLETAKAANSNVVTGALTVGGLSIGVGALAGATTLLSELWSAISVPVQTILYAGYYLSIWIPLVPFFIFALGVVGWLITVVEAVAASSLWCVMHMTPESNDSFIGGQQQGYLLLLSVFFRPSLMILGLVASLGMASPVMHYINWSFVIAFRVVQTDSMTGLFTIAVLLIVYSFLVSSVLMLIFSLPQVLPDRILRWVSAGTGDLGESSGAARVERGASGQARMALAAQASRSAQAKHSLHSAMDARRGEQSEAGKQSTQLEGMGGQSSITRGDGI